MPVDQVVLDTNVWIAALRSKRGASYTLLSLIDSGMFETNLSVPLVLEYEDAAKRLVGEFPLAAQDIDDILDYICSVAHHRKIYYLWRPHLSDPRDDMVLELAVSAKCDFIVTFNQSDFSGAEVFGVRILTPKELLQRIGVVK